MLIALFGLIAASLLVGSDSPYLLPETDKLAKNFITDEGRKEDVLSLMADYEKEWKTLSSIKKRQAKEVSRKLKDRTVTSTELIADLQYYQKERKKLSLLIIHHRVQIQEIVKDEEWNEIFETGYAKLEKQNKELEYEAIELWSHNNDDLNKIFTKTESIFYGENRIRVENLISNFQKTIVQSVYDNQANQSRALQLLNNRMSTEYEFIEMYDAIETNRMNLQYAFLDLRLGINDIANDKEWKSAAKQLDKLVE